MMGRGVLSFLLLLPQPDDLLRPPGGGGRRHILRRGVCCEMVSNTASDENEKGTCGD